MSRRKQLNPKNIKQQGLVPEHLGIESLPQKSNCDNIKIERDHSNNDQTTNATTNGKRKKRKGKKSTMAKTSLKKKQKTSESSNKEQGNEQKMSSPEDGKEIVSKEKVNSSDKEMTEKDTSKDEQASLTENEKSSNTDLSNKAERNGENSNEESLQCPICKCNIQPTTDWISHVKHHGPVTDDHVCVICEKRLSSSSSLDRHMLAHSGKKPFKCKYCSQSFTTNGNMHRHIRSTHSEVDESSVSARDPGKQNGKRKNSSTELNGEDSNNSLSKKSRKEEITEVQEKSHCLVCGKTFLCNYGLQTHMETHPNDPIQCQECGDISSNYNVYKSHKCNTAQEKKEESNPIGFHEIDFVDFSSEKFGLIAKSFFENNVRRPSSAFHKFQCSKCEKAFPCGSALTLHGKVHSKSPSTYCPSCNCDFPDSSHFQAHQLKHRSAEHCIINDNELNQVNHTSNHKQTESRKEDFLAVLELQNHSISKLALKLNDRKQEDNFENLLYFTHGKSESVINKTQMQSTNGDFADIQDILSITSKNSLLDAVRSTQAVISPASPVQKSVGVLPESPLPADSASPNTPSNEVAEHQSDIGDTVTLSDSASSGSHQCINCNQSFKNAKALKRHRRVHSQGSPSFSCEVCNYISLDKSTLIRHLRTHNGERPFQCAICKYAFTTKANCERHIQKKHKKVTKQEISSAMEYNPNMSNVMASNSIIPESSGSETICKYCNVDFKASRHLRHHLRSLNNSCHRKPYHCKACNVGFSTKNNCHRHIQNQHPEIKDKADSIVIINGRNDTSEQETVHSSDQSCQENNLSLESEPLNLMRKSVSPPLETDEITENNDDSMDERESIATSLLNLSQCPIQEEALDLAIHPLDLRQKMSSQHEMEAMPVSIYCLPSYHNLSSSCHPSQNYPLSQSVTKVATEPLLPDSKPLCLVSNSTQNVATFAHDVIPCEMTFKMVNNRLSLKNQRPFRCRHCGSGFTLKSNMERHIKRKHPQYARPPRSRNYLPTLTPPNIHRHSGSTLSTKTRDALREVLNNKSNNLSNNNNNQSNKKQDSEMLLPRTSALEDNHSISKQEFLTKSISDRISDINIPLRPTAFSRNHPNNLLSGTKGECESQDLASVSDVIDTANSQEFKQYFRDIQNSEKGRMSTNSNTEQTEGSSETLEFPRDDEVNVASTKKKSSYANSRRSVPCPYCHRKFPWTSSLRRHILTHTGHKPYKCPRCPVLFTTKSNCDRHMSRKHGQNGRIARSVPERPYKCNICSSSTFATQGNLRKHYYVKHCRKTGNNIKQSGNLGKTENSHTVTDEYDFVLQGNETVSCSQDDENEMPFIVCQYCKQSFSSTVELLVHIEEHKEADVVYKCHLCDDSFVKRHDCISHLKFCHVSEYDLLLSKGVIVEDETDNNSKFPNREVTESRVTDSNVNSEQSKALDYTERKVVCVFCFNRFWSNGDLKRHMRTHTGERPFSCNVCRRMFSLKHSMIRHQNKHFSLMVQSGMGEKNHLSDTALSNLKRSCSNSLLYLMYKEKPDDRNGMTVSAAAIQDVEERTKEVSRDQNDGSSDLIQNLLGIKDSTMLDKMLDSADSAARILGVNEMC